jgi:homoserine dehydrogenase
MAAVRQINVVLLGVGGVGRALVEQISRHRHLHAERYGVALEIVALADSSGALVGDPYLSDETLATALELKAGGSRFADWPDALPATDPQTLLRALASRLGPQTVVVDCTATERTAPALLDALDAGCKIVLANKKPLTIDQEVYNRLTRAGSTEGPLALDRARWETTCGAGLPVIVTLQRLLLSGDEVERITGTFSGTLGYVMTGLQQGRRFSEVVREAHQLGYTEPDPRDDLGGVDVARKALILARGLGWQMDMEDVEVQGLYPLHMDRLSVAEFLAALPQLDGFFADRVQQAADQKGVLRFAALVAEGRCVVGPTVVAASSPLGRLSGTDNLIEFQTNWYSPNPLVVQGRGAGVEATAAGVLSDLLELAWTRD